MRRATTKVQVYQTNKRHLIIYWKKLCRKFNSLNIWNYGYYLLFIHSLSILNYGYLTLLFIRLIYGPWDCISQNDSVNVGARLLSFFSSKKTRWASKALKYLVFSVASMKQLLYKAKHPIQYNILEWNNWIPLKVNAVAYKAFQNLLSTSDYLIKRSILFGFGNLHDCTMARKSGDHVLTSWYICCEWCDNASVCGIISNSLMLD